MYCKKYSTAVILSIYLVISTQISYASNKSVFVISSHDGYKIQAYRIDANHITLQTTTKLSATSHLIDLAAWPQKNLIFESDPNEPNGP